MLRRAYEWMMRRAASPEAPLWLAIFAFCEGVFFPIPPDVMLMPMVLASRDKAWRYAGICLAASVLGGSVGYSVGFFLHPLGNWLISLTGGDPAAFLRWYHRWGVLLLVVPIPYKLAAIASGLGGIRFIEFFIASIFIRGARFFLVATLLRVYGPPIQDFIERRLVFVVSAIGLVVVAAILAVTFLLHHHHG
jgi:membrane protein YqaA with SNARE-associated domain